MIVTAEGANSGYRDTVIIPLIKAEHRRRVAGRKTASCKGDAFVNFGSDMRVINVFKEGHKNKSSSTVRVDFSPRKLLNSL